MHASPAGADSNAKVTHAHGGCSAAPLLCRQQRGLEDGRQLTDTSQQFKSWMANILLDISWHCHRLLNNYSSFMFLFGFPPWQLGFTEQISKKSLNLFYLRCSERREVDLRPQSLFDFWGLLWRSGIWQMVLAVALPDNVLHPWYPLSVDVATDG